MISEYTDKIIDSHVHMGTYGPYKIKIEDLVNEMDRSGVAQAVISDIGLNSLDEQGTQRFPDIDTITLNSRSLKIINEYGDRERASDFIARCPNLYGDTTLVSKEEMRKAIEKCGPEKILFGTDALVFGRDSYGGTVRLHAERSLYLLLPITPKNLWLRILLGYFLMSGIFLWSVLRIRGIIKGIL